jgi:hypothetical protein
MLSVRRYRDWRGVVQTAWIQRTRCGGVRAAAPTHGRVEIHFPIGGHTQLIGPLTGWEIKVIPAHAAIVGAVLARDRTAPFRGCSMTGWTSAWAWRSCGEAQRTASWRR